MNVVLFLEIGLFDGPISFNVFQCAICDLIFTDANLDERGYSDVHF